jgi:polygalacturonase
VRNVVISNCVFDGTDRGLRFKTARGRGNVVENVRASNIVMRNVSEAVSVTMFYTGGDRHIPQPASELTPMFRNLHFSEIVARGVKHAAIIEGLPEMPIQRLSINNFVVEDAAAGITCTNAKGVVFDTIVVNTEDGPALNVEDVRDLEVYRCTTDKPHAAEPAIRFQKVNNAVVQSCSAADGTGTFLELKGSENREISLFANRLTRAGRDIALTAGASESAIVAGSTLSRR